MADHSEILPRLCAYHDGALPAREREQIEQHVQACPECRARLKEWAALDDALHGIDEPAPAPGRIADLVMRRVAGRITTPEQSPAAWYGSRAGRRAMIAAAAAVVVLAAAAGLWRLTSGPPLPKTETAQIEPVRPSPPVRASEQTPEPRSPEQTEGEQERQAPDQAPGASADLALTLQDNERPEPAPPPVESNTKAAARRAPEGTYAAAPVPIRPEDSGIPQVPGGPARPAFVADIHYRFYDRLDLTYVELNLVPVFEVEFVPVGYALVDRLAGQWDAANPEPTLLNPQEAYLVSNLRIERATLLTLVVNQAPTSDVRMRLAEVTWRLANLTADQDDVRSAISAQSEAMRQATGASTELRGRLAYLRGLIR